MRVELVQEWEKFYKWSSARLLIVATVLYGSLIEGVPLLAEHWPAMAPFILKYFPTADAAVGPFIGAVLTFLARIIVIRFPPKASGS